VAQKKLDEYNALNAMLNGTAERAMDAFARAYALGTKPEYKTRMKKNVQDAYKVRFGKETGVDEWIASATKKPFVDPTTPVTPVTDSTPTAAAPASATTPAAAGQPAQTDAKPAPAPAKTVAKPTSVAKPISKKTVAKKRGA